MGAFVTDVWKSVLEPYHGKNRFWRYNGELDNEVYLSYVNCNYQLQDEEEKEAKW